MTHLLGWLAIPAYIGYGVVRFHDLFSSPRYVRHPMQGSLWGPGKLLNAETWTPEGLARRNQLLAWQVGLIAIVLLLALLP